MMSLFAVSASPSVAAHASRPHRAPAPSTRRAASARHAAIPGGSLAPAMFRAFEGATSSGLKRTMLAATPMSGMDTLPIMSQLLKMKM